MKKLFLAATLIISAAQYSSATSIFMGAVESVYQDSLTGALRNPAMIPAQGSQNTLGLLMKYQAYFSNSIAVNMNVPFIDNEKVDYNVDKSMAGTGFFSYTGRSGDIGYGIGIGAMEDDQYRLTKSSVKIAGNVPSSTSTTRIISEEVSTSYYPSLSLSLGTRVGDTSFAGFKLTGGYQRIITEKHETGHYNAVLNDKKKSSLQSESYSAEAQFGFFTFEGNSQAGLMIKSGTFSMTKLSIEHDATVPVMAKGSDETPLYRQMRKGPSIVAGGYTQLTGAVGLALEGEYRISSYYNDRYFDDNMYTQQTMKRTNNPEYQLRGGMDFKMTPSIKAMIGGGAYFSGSRGEDQGGKTFTRKKEEMNFKAFYATAGFDFNLTKNTKIVIGAIGQKILVDGESMSDLNMKLKNTQYTLNALAGLSTAF